MWSKLTETLIEYKTDGSISVYDESGLRASLTRYLSDESRERFDGEQSIFEKKHYLHGIEWHMDGLKLFYA